MVCREAALLAIREALGAEREARRAQGFGFRGGGLVRFVQGFVSVHWVLRA